MLNAKPRNDTLEDTLGEKPTQIPEGVVKSVETERVGSSRDMNLLPTEKEKLDNLDLQGLKVNNYMQVGAMLDGDTPILECSKH